MTPHRPESATASTTLDERYGRKRPGKRRTWPWVVAAGVAVTVATAVLVPLSGSPYSAALLRWELPTEDAYTVTVEIARDPGLALTCDLIAVDARHFVVGQAQVEVPAGDETHLLVTADIPLRGAAVAPELVGCQPTD